MLHTWDMNMIDWCTKHQETMRYDWHLDELYCLGCEVDRRAGVSSEQETGTVTVVV